jgi:hypothetical protein
MSLHRFDKTHIDEDCEQLAGRFKNELFFNCRFKKLNDLVLEDCELNQSEFNTDSVRDALGVTMTLSCKSFRGMTMSPLLFDLYLLLAYLTKGNDLKREKLLDVIGRPRALALLKLLEATE